MLTFLPVTLLAFLVAIGLLIAVHEYGHFRVARALGFRVLTFSVGFGRTLWSRVGRDGVEYRVGLFPLGGYVRLLDAREGEVTPAEHAGSWQGRPPWARILMLLAGPGANFLFAIVAFWGLFQLGVPGLRPVVGEVTLGSPAATAGLRSADELVAVAGEAVRTREGAILGLVSALVDGKAVPVQVRGADGNLRELRLEVPPERRLAATEPGGWSRGLGFEFSRPYLPPVLGQVVTGKPAALAGLQSGDRLVRVAGVPVEDFAEVVAQVRPRGGETVTLEYRRAGELRTVQVAVASELDAGLPVGRIGVSPGEFGGWPPGMETVERYGPLGAIGPAFTEMVDKTLLTLKFLVRMLTGDVSVKNISGPISIATAAGVTALEGPGYYLQFLAVISLSLAVLNLLPVPVLDGGQVVFQLAEWARGRPLPERLQLLTQQVGMALLAVMMGIAFYNDLARHFG
ncbi:MAG: RIP metalloprotease RseP [Gammaproteobacteria bacterium]